MLILWYCWTEDGEKLIQEHILKSLLTPDIDAAVDVADKFEVAAFAEVSVSTAAAWIVVRLFYAIENNFLAIFSSNVDWYWVAESLKKAACVEDSVKIASDGVEAAAVVAMWDDFLGVELSAVDVD